MNYPNLFASVWIGIRTNYSRELFVRIIRVSVKRAVWVKRKSNRRRDSFLAHWRCYCFQHPTALAKTIICALQKAFARWSHKTRHYRYTLSTDRRIFFLCDFYATVGCKRTPNALKPEHLPQWASGEDMRCIAISRCIMFSHRA